MPSLLIFCPGRDEQIAPCDFLVTTTTTAAADALHHWLQETNKSPYEQNLQFSIHKFIMTRLHWRRRWSGLPNTHPLH